MQAINSRKLIFNLTSIILVLVLNIYQTNELSYSLNFTNLNQKLQALDPKFLEQFSQSYRLNALQNLSDAERGNFLFLLGKMYLYDIFPKQLNFARVGKRPYSVSQFHSKGRYALAYFYLLVSAQKYQNGDAYYYLAVLDFMKISPSLLVKSSIRQINRRLKKLLNAQHIKNDGLKRKIKSILNEWKQVYTIEELTQISQYLDQISFDIQSMHLNSVQHNLFLASLNGHTKAKLTLAYLLKQGINIQKNCSTSASYYLSAIKSQVIDTFSFSLDYKDQNNFQKQLYARQRVDLKNYGNYDTSIFDNSLIFDKQTLMDYQDMALNLISGSDGFPINQTLGIQILQKLRDSSRVARITLAFLYLKGKGVKKNYNAARQIFQQDGRQANKDILLAMKYYDLGFQGGRAQALSQYKALFEKYEKRKLKVKQEKQKLQKSSLSIQQKEQRNILIDGIQKTQLETSTPLTKYMVGSLIMADEITGTKQLAKQLLEQSDRKGNILATNQLAFMYLDGSFDNKFNCEKAVNYFYKSTMMNPVIQRRIEMAKIGIKKEKYMFAFIKYIQLMMVGFKHAHVNSIYLMKVYGQELFKFSPLSWSTSEASKSKLYKFLLSSGIIPSISKYFHKYLGLNTQGLFGHEVLDLLTGPENSNGSIGQYEQYMGEKISRIGISKHQISILLFLKYKESEEFSILQKLVEIPEDRPHISESQFLLGRYYQHYTTSRSQRERRNKKAIQQYSKATKNKFLGKIIFLIEGGEWKQDDIIFSHLLWFLTILLVVFIFLYRKKNKNIQQILLEEGLKSKQEQITETALKEKEKQIHFTENRDADQTNSFTQEKKRVQQYQRPKFSQQQQQNVKSQTNLMKIRIMLEERKKSQQTFDRDQPIIIDEDQEGQVYHH